MDLADALDETKEEYTDNELDDVMLYNEEINYSNVLKKQLGDDVYDDLTDEQINELNGYAEQMLNSHPYGEDTKHLLRGMVDDYRLKNKIDDYSIYEYKEEKQQKRVDFSYEKSVAQRKAENALGYAYRKFIGR